MTLNKHFTTLSDDSFKICNWTIILRTPLYSLIKSYILLTVGFLANRYHKFISENEISFEIAEKNYQLKNICQKIVRQSAKEM